MSSSTSFTSVGFSVQKVTQQGPATVRVRFTQDPMAVDAGGANDGLNPSLYTLSGPGSNIVTLVTPVLSDPQSLDLTLSETLLPGSWVLYVGAVVSSESTAIQNPASGSFNVEVLYDLPAISQGAESDGPEQVIRKHLPLSFKGKAWDSLIYALSLGDKINWDNAKAAFDQLFKTSAVGKYLDRRAADTGISRPQGVGINDELFRKLAIKATNKKLIHEVLWEVLEVFYGSDSVRAFVETNAVEPYSMQDGDELDLLLDEKQFIKIVFRAADFARPGQAEATEIAAAITRILRLNKIAATALTIKDSVTGSNKVRIYSGSLGLSSSVRVLGGRSQVQLKFPELINTPLSSANPSLISWNITIPETGVAKWELTGSVPVNLSLVEEGDYVCAYGSAIDPNNRGTFAIKQVVTELAGTTLKQYLLVENSNVVAQNFTQLTLNDVLFFRPKKHTPQTLGNRDAIVSQTSPGSLNIIIPATTQAVTRRAGIAAYPPENDSINVTEVKGVGNTITVTANGHGLSAGDYVLLDGAESNNVAPTLHAATAGYTDASLQSHWYEADPTATPPTIDGAIVALGDKALIIGGEYINFDVPVYNAILADCSLIQMGSSTTLSDGSKKYQYTQTVADSMATARKLMGASAYDSNLKVLVTGGGSVYNNILSIGALNTTEIYDIASDTWSSGPNLPSARAGQVHVLLDNNNTLIVGGVSGVYKAHNNSYLFDPSANTIAPTGSMSKPRVDHRVVKLQDGRVLVIGGRTLGVSADSNSRTLALWKMDDSGATAVDSSANAFTLTASGSTTPNIEGKIDSARSFAGGHLAKTSASPAAVTALTDEWTLESWIGKPDVSSASGTLISFGGATSASSDNRLLEFRLSVGLSGYDFTLMWENGSANAVTMTGTLNFSNWGHLAIVKKKNVSNPSNYDVSVYMNGLLRGTFADQANCSGGANGYWYLGRSSKAGPANWAGKIDETRISTYAKTEAEILVALRRGSGGLYERIGECLAACEIYNPSTGTWTSTGSMASARAFHTAHLLNDGRVYVIGGIGYEAAGKISASVNSGGIDYRVLNTCEMYDPQTGTWSGAGKMSTPRWGHSSEYLSDRNQVLIGFMGGNNGNSESIGLYNTRVEIYDVDSKKYSLVKDPVGGFNDNSKSVRFDNGLVMFNGGIEVSGLSWYDENSNPDFRYLWSQWTYIPAEDSISHQNINGIHKVETASSTEFTYSVPSAAASSNYNANVKAVTVSAPIGVEVGPYIFTPDETPAITSIESSLSAAIYKGQQYHILSVADASVFPDEEGWLWIGYGQANGFGPVKYLGRNSTTSLLLDFNYKIPANVDIGTAVTLLTGNTPFQPNSNSFPAYLTGSSIGRVAAQAQVESMVAAGIDTNFYIKYPGDVGLGGAGLPVTGSKISDKVRVWAGDDVDAEVAEAREE